MKRREFLKLSGMAYAQASRRKPNILFILADDLGIGGLSCYGADQFRTPQIDALAAGGTRYTHAYTAPLCGPSRALIMTGRYAFRTGATNQDATGEMKPSVETMIPKVLRQAGYASTMIGKWGQLPLKPADFGFDESLLFRGSGVYWNTQEKGEVYWVNGEVRKLADKEYLPDVMHTHLADFFARHRNQPFFAYYSLSHVHADILPTPDSMAQSTDLYADNIRYMDKLVGRAVAELDRLNLRDNTLVVFFGDNGTGQGYARRSTIGGRPLSGEKGSMLEGGALVPMIVNWPGKAAAGKVSAEMVDSTDFLPTFAELAGAALPGKTTVDGRSFAPSLLGQSSKPARDWVFIQLARKWYVRDASYKLNEAGQLFDMRESPFSEPEIPRDKVSGSARLAHQRLAKLLEELNPAGGILDQGDGTGRHSGRKQKQAK
ncbi:MAG: sulfatase-like hydrolase/transferase [Bryobacterales bacterium]|nr:sulfatase-like hydrolase/transferase [Bryobacterales bacterium]